MLFIVPDPRKLSAGDHVYVLLPRGLCDGVVEDKLGTKEKIAFMVRVDVELFEMIYDEKRKMYIGLVIPPKYHSQ